MLTMSWYFISYWYYYSY